MEPSDVSPAASASAVAAWALEAGEPPEVEGTGAVDGAWAAIVSTAAAGARPGTASVGAAGTAGADGDPGEARSVSDSADPSQAIPHSGSTSHAWRRTRSTDPQRMT